MTDAWVAQWKNIAKICGGVCIRTAKKYHKNYGMPVHRLPDGRTPAVIPAEIQAWLIHFNKLQDKNN